MTALVELGATGARSIAIAVQSSPVIIVCIDNYSTTRDLLGSSEIANLLADRTLVQLSTGTPQEAQDSQAWFKNRRASYIDGAILCGPDSIGTDDGKILFAGPQVAYASCEPMLRSLAGGLRYLGENIRAPAALDLAWLTELFGVFIGTAHGARVCEAENVGIDLYSSLFPPGAVARWFADVIHAKAYANPTATLQVWTEALKRIQIQATDAGINREFPDFVADILKRATSAGHGEESIAALYKVLKKTGGS